MSSQSIVNPGGWWLDVELANSWCGQHGATCDLSLNQYTIQGIIDTLTAASATPVGVYSTAYQWAAITGNLPVTGISRDWVATVTRTPQQAAAYCFSGFAGAPVVLVQFLQGRIDHNRAC